MDQQKEVQVHSRPKKKVLTVVLITGAIMAAIIGGVTVYQQNRNEEKYQAAITAKESGNYETAISLFQELGNYKDSTNMIQATYDAQADAQTLEYLQTTYDYISKVWNLDNELVDIVSTVIENVETLNSINGDSLLDRTTYLISASHKDAISNLYSGKGYSAYRSCSYLDALRMEGILGSAANIRQSSSGWYSVSVPIHTEQTALTFVDALEAAGSIMKFIEDATPDTGIPSEKYQQVWEQLNITYEALKNYHSLVAIKPTDYDHYNTLAQEKMNAVNSLLSTITNLEPAICN